MKERQIEFAAQYVPVDEYLKVRKNENISNEELQKILSAANHIDISLDSPLSKPNNIIIKFARNIAKKIDPDTFLNARLELLNEDEAYHLEWANRWFAPGFGCDEERGDKHFFASIASYKDAQLTKNTIEAMNLNSTLLR